MRIYIILNIYECIRGLCNIIILLSYTFIDLCGPRTVERELFYFFSISTLLLFIHHRPKRVRI